MRLRLVTRAGCHLCEDAEAALEAFGAAFELTDVDEDAELARLYDFRVPVLLDGDRVLLEGRIDQATLRSALPVQR